MRGREITLERLEPREHLQRANLTFERSEAVERFEQFEQLQFYSEPSAPLGSTLESCKPLEHLEQASLLKRQLFRDKSLEAPAPRGIPVPIPELLR